jgi:peptidyl-prolyl cis-trans isomerase A (cyclophilin A)
MSLLVRLLLVFAALLASPAAAAPGEVAVRLLTSEGAIVVAVDTRRAPITARNFLRYVDQKRFDDTSFYRAARTKADPRFGLIQGGIRRNARRTLAPIAHEPTSRTGLRHVDGTLSMARNSPGTAMGDFFIVLGRGPYLDAAPNYAGYAAFGRVLSGMDVARRILAKPTWPGGYSFDTMGQSIRDRVKIISATRVQ